MDYNTANKRKKGFTVTHFLFTSLTLGSSCTAGSRNLMDPDNKPCASKDNKKLHLAPQPSGEVGKGEQGFVSGSGGNQLSQEDQKELLVKMSEVKISDDGLPEDGGFESIDLLGNPDPSLQWPSQDYRDYYLHQIEAASNSTGKNNTLNARHVEEFIFQKTPSAEEYLRVVSNYLRSLSKS